MGQTIPLDAAAGITVTGWYSLSRSPTVLSELPSPSTITSVIPGGLPSCVTQTFMPEEPVSLAIIASQASTGYTGPFMVITGQESKRGTQVHHLVEMQPYCLLLFWAYYPHEDGDLSSCLQVTGYKKSKLLMQQL